MNAKTKYQPIANESQFRDWLLSNYNLSKRAIGDNISRCRRVQSILNEDLYPLMINDASEQDITDKIKSYALDVGNGSKAIYALKATLTHSVKKYRLFSQQNL